LEPRFGKLGREYRQIVFDKKLLFEDATVEWATPGHPLFEVVREDVLAQVQQDLQHGAVFYDLNRPDPARLDVFSAAIRDGRGNVLHRRMFVMEAALDGALSLRQPTIFLDASPAPKGTAVPEHVLSDARNLPPLEDVETALVQQALQPFLQEITTERQNKSTLSHAILRSA